MRFALLQTKRGTQTQSLTSTTRRMILVGYNVVWWVPVVLAAAGLTSYKTGLLSFLATTVARALVNLYRNNLLPEERAENFPLRSP